MAGPVRLGLVGAGRWGRSYIRTLAALPQVRLARLASRNPESASLVPAECVISADWRALVEAGDLDGVILATPPQLHAGMASRCIEAGLPVLVEKPLTMDPGEARALRDLAHARATLVMVGHTHLFHPAYRALKAMQPRFGAIRAIHGEAGNLGPYRRDVPVLWDWGPHDVAMALDLAGGPAETVSARVLERRVVEGGIGESVRVELAWPGGRGAVLRWSNLEPRRRRLTVTCERATLVYDDLAADKLVVAEDGTPAAVAIAKDLPLGVEVAEFAAAIAQHRVDAASLELGVQVVETLAAASGVATGP